MPDVEHGAVDHRRDERESSRRLKIVHVVSGLEIVDGGPSYSVPRLKDALRQAGLDAIVFTDLTPGDLANDGSEQVFSFARNYGRLPLLRKFHFSKDLARRLNNETDRIDLMHSHGLWRMPNIYASRSARQRRVPHIVAPRGMLSAAALQLSRRGKRLFWHFAQKAALEGAACLHATSSAECADIRNLGIKTPIAIVPNGVDLPDRATLTQAEEQRSAGRQRTLLYLGRIHPIKGLDDLVAAWSEVEPELVEWRLRIVGPGESEYVATLRRMMKQLGLRRISIEGPVFGADKWPLILAADLSILPSHTENFGMAVAESLACGRPVITTKGTPWKHVETQKCGWWIDTGPASIAAALRLALSAPSEVLGEMGARGETWVKRAYSWDRIGQEMAEIYRWLCLGQNKPDCVVLD